MAAIRLDYPTAASPTASVVLSPAFTAVQPFRRTVIQKRLVAEDLTEYIYRVSANVEHTFEMVFTDLQEGTDGSFSGVTTLLAFINTTLEYSYRTCQMTDADAVVETVRFWSDEAELREADGIVRQQGRFSGRFLWRRAMGA